MKFTILISIAGALLLVGCASPSTHDHHSMMGCGKCQCKMMQAAANDAHKCAKCGHADADHTKASDGSAHAGHQH